MAFEPRAVPEDAGWSGDLKQVVRPIGLFRFLTQFDTIAEGDLFRAQVAVHTDRDAAYGANWTPISSGWVGKNPAEENHMEFIRMVEGTTVPAFDLSAVLAREQRMKDRDADTD